MTKILPPLKFNFEIQAIFVKNLNTTKIEKKYFYFLTINNEEDDVYFSTFDRLSGVLII
jgi:hypothetical protein